MWALQDDHALSACEGFRRQTPLQWYETVQRQGYCRNCLAKSHLAPDCPSLTDCRRCNDQHHTLLHGESQLDEVFLNIEAVTTPAFAWDLVFVQTAMVRITAKGTEGFSMLRTIVNQSSTMSKISYAAFRR
uniref:CCHC-type domain-containing protein n=1 Tax=Musca domestica TaxID=7370 RepID=A0A1I8NJ76_MUSDO